MPDEREEATSLADTFHRHGDPDPSKWEEQEAVTGRPADAPPPNTTLAERARVRRREEKDEDRDEKRVHEAANKAVQAAERSKGRARKSGK